MAGDFLKIGVFPQMESEYIFKTCKDIQRYLSEKTNMKCEVHKTERYILVCYISEDSIKTSKIRIPGGVLYCFQTSDFDGLIEEMS